MIVAGNTLEANDLDACEPRQLSRHHAPCYASADNHDTHQARPLFCEAMTAARMWPCSLSVSSSMVWPRTLPRPRQGHDVLKLQRHLSCIRSFTAFVRDGQARIR
jgi:hypothetical protein